MFKWMMNWFSIRELFSDLYNLFLLSFMKIFHMLHIDSYSVYQINVAFHLIETWWCDDRFENELLMKRFTKSFISHLTHCMQSLNVRIFQLYKKWHDMIIKKFIAKSFVEYSLTWFLSDFTKIRNNIFKSIIIRHVFEKSCYDFFILD
jgi:hypothetical protein